MSEQTTSADNLKSGNAWAWLTVVGLGFLGGGGLVTILANAGNFIPHICEELKMDPGQLTLWITCYAIFMAISQLYVGRLWPKVNTKLLILVSFLVSIAAMAMMGLYTEAWQFWISGAVIGLSGGVYFMVAAPILVTNWFAKHVGLALGVTGIIGGLLAVVLSPIDAMIVSAVGWRMGYLVVAIISCVMVLPWILLVFVYDPKKKGMRPFGWEPGMKDISAGSQKAPGIPANKALLTVPFICIFLAAGTFALYGGYQNLWGFAAAEWGFDPMFTATMISASSLFMLLGPVIGLVIDKIGPYKTSFGVMVIQLLASLGLLYFHSSDIGVLVLVFFFAFQGAIVGSTTPLLIRESFGAKDYTKILSYTQIGIGLIGGFSAPVVSFFYTSFNSFGASLVFGAGIAVFGLVCMILATLTKNSTIKAKWEEE